MVKILKDHLGVRPVKQYPVEDNKPWSPASKTIPYGR